MLETKCVGDNFEMFVTVLTLKVQTTTVVRSHIHNINCGFIDMVQDMNFKNFSRKPYHIVFLESLNEHRIVRFNPGGWSLTFTKWSARIKIKIGISKEVLHHSFFFINEPSSLSVHQISVG